MRFWHTFLFLFRISWKHLYVDEAYILLTRNIFGGKIKHESLQERIFCEGFARDSK